VEGSAAVRSNCSALSLLKQGLHNSIVERDWVAERAGVCSAAVALGAAIAAAWAEDFVGHAVLAAAALETAIAAARAEGFAGQMVLAGNLAVSVAAGGSDSSGNSQLDVVVLAAPAAFHRALRLSAC
jgi:hypothetical protein